MKTQADTAASRWLRSVDRATLVSMNPPASHALAASGKATEHRTEDNRDAVSVTASNNRPEGESAMTAIELEHELEHLHDAAVWSLNAAIEAGWDDAIAGISDSYVADERSLLRRWGRKSAAAA